MLLGFSSVVPGIEVWRSFERDGNIVGARVVCHLGSTYVCMEYSSDRAIVALWELGNLRTCIVIGGKRFLLVFIA